MSEPTRPAVAPTAPRGAPPVDDRAAAAADLLDHRHGDPGQHAGRAGHPRHPRRLPPARLARRPVRGRGHAPGDRHGAGHRRAGRPLRPTGRARARASSGFGVFGLLSALAPSFEVLLVLRLLQGIGSAGLINLAVVIIGDHWDGHRPGPPRRPERRRAHRVARRLPADRWAAHRARAAGGCRSRPTASAWPPPSLIWRRLDPARPDDRRHAASAAGRCPPGGPAPGRARVDLDRLRDLHADLRAVPHRAPGAPRARVRARRRARGASSSPPPPSRPRIAALRLGRVRARFGAVAIVAGAAVLFTVAFVDHRRRPARCRCSSAAPCSTASARASSSRRCRTSWRAPRPPPQRGAVVALWVGAARAGQTVGPLAAAGIYGAVGTHTTFVLGGALAATLVVAEAVGRFGDDRPLRLTARRARQGATMRRRSASGEVGVRRVSRHVDVDRIAQVDRWRDGWG